jgi:hypothetical protein
MLYDYGPQYTGNNSPVALYLTVVVVVEEAIVAALQILQVTEAADAVYFDLSSAFDLVPHSLLLNKLSASGLPVTYVNWARKCEVRLSSILSSPFDVLPGVLQGSVRGTLLLNASLTTYATQLPTPTVAVRSRHQHLPLHQIF